MKSIANARGAVATARQRCRRGWSTTMVALLIWAEAAAAAGAESADTGARPSKVDFSMMTIEELMQVPLTLSRTDERLFETPAAAYIITAEDIRRSGATSIPEALRGVPGVEVARVDAHTWAVTARGFNDSFANKLLVMIDGRSVYTPLFSGVFWDVQDTMMEDIDHIEIVRGPGSTLWGANAVNGVINIVTKDAAHTQGGLLTAGAGIGEQGFGALRYGGRFTEELHYRVYVKYFDREDTELHDGSHSGEWDAIRGGFRMDWTPGVNAARDPAPDLFTLEGEMYSGSVDQFFSTTRTIPVPHTATVHDLQHMDGGFVLGRWNHEFRDDNTLQIQAYYDRTHRSLVIFGEQRDTFDLDLQHHFKLGDRQDFVWGAGYRVTDDRTADTPTVFLAPSSRVLNLFSTFAQDEITLIDQTLRLTLGSKVEHNDLTGWEVQPGARLLWTPATNQSAWASVTRAVRTPSRAEDDVRITTVTAGIPVRLMGDRDFSSEKVIAYELGYRIQPVRTVSFDVATFYNEYDELRTLEFVQATPSFVVQKVGNRMDGSTAGVEIGSTWDVTRWWKLRGSYTWFEMDLNREARSSNPANDVIERSSPRQQFMIRSLLDLPHNVEFDVAFRYVESVATQKVTSPGVDTLHVPAYPSLDVRLAWRPWPNVEFSVVGQSLLQDRHPEFKPTTIPGPATEVERSVYGKVAWQF